MITVKVDRKTWYRGKGGEQSRLLRVDGQRCCIGFLAKALKVKDKEMENVTDLSELSPCKRTDPLDDEYSEPLNHAYNVNDDEQICDHDREQELIATGKMMGVHFIFEN